jgi:predicted ATP-dependent endonuclease of OLD family
LKLTKIHVRDFHSIRDSNEFTVGDVTCLVGKNEAGKTALLQAIYRLRPIVAEDAGYSVTDDYPRRDVSDYEHDVENGDREHAVVAELTYELGEEDTAAVAKNFGPDALTSKIVTLSKAYEQDGVTFSLDVHETAALRHLIGQWSLPDDALQRLLALNTPTEVKSALATMEQTDAVKKLTQWMDAIIAEKSVKRYIFNKIIYSRVPKFLYFDEYYQMRGCDNIEALKQRVAAKTQHKSDYPMLGLINKARLDLDGLLNPTRTRDLKNSLEGAGNHLTKSIVKYWSQNKHLQMRFDVRPAKAEDPEGMRSGTNIWAEVYDTRHMVTTELGSRSRGFVWFFSFLAWYGDVQRDKQNVILLLDEPGTSLHGKAQADLLRYFEEELVPNHQLIYTTHSPFMVDSTRFDRVRIVQDKSVDSVDEVPPEEEGTKVTTEVLEASDDSLFPLQGALGYDLTQTLFVGANSLVVEGVSDLLYLQVMSATLQAAGREGLAADWTITPVGGSDKVPTFVALLGARSQLNLVTLIDFQEKDRQAIENMWRRKLIQKKQVITFADFVGAKEADIEDMFGEAFYLKLVNAEYAASLSAPVAAKNLKSKLPRITVRLEQHFAEAPLAKGATFNHYRPARHFAENVSKLQVPDDVLDRFERLFKEVNQQVRRTGRPG